MINIILNKFYNKKTNFKGGYVNFARDKNLKISLCSSIPKFQAPRKLDFRDMCLRTDNQGTSPKCAGYSMAGFIEIIDWKKNYYPKQVNADSIYNTAKQIEGKKYDGTTLDHVAQASIKLKLIAGTPKRISKSVNDIKFAIHKFNSLVGGFLINSDWNNCNTKTGIIPESKKITSLGGHGVLICGYDPNGIYIQNSWGESWGLYGFAFLDWNQVIQQFIYGIVIE